MVTRGKGWDLVFKANEGNYHSIYTATVWSFHTIMQRFNSFQFIN